MLLAWGKSSELSYGVQPNPKEVHRKEQKIIAGCGKDGPKCTALSFSFSILMGSKLCYVTEHE
jgi:hypothetical protein